MTPRSALSSCASGSAGYICASLITKIRAYEPALVSRDFQAARAPGARGVAVGFPGSPRPVHLINWCEARVAGANDFSRLQGRVIAGVVE
jgi:hypothetical protein